MSQDHVRLTNGVEARNGFKVPVKKWDSRKGKEPRIKEDGDSIFERPLS